MILAAAGPSPLWYLSRGTGAVTLVLLSMTVVLGITGTLRWRPGTRTPRFVVDGLHRNVSLLVVVLLAAHVLTALLDPFAHLRVLDAFLPLASHYRPLWLGLGALALDVLIALTVTSLLRARLGLRAWRAVHWAAYACWPVAVLHGLGTGTDARSVWLQALTAACVGAVVVALAARLLRDWPARAGLRVGGLGLVGAALVGAVVFAVQGPLAQGWASRAGTPAPLLAASRTPVAGRAVSAAPTPGFPSRGP
jgi:sulfoxide reductase heme-binding subunit YedZ